jgi:alkaline phosphatase D
VRRFAIRSLFTWTTGIGAVCARGSVGACIAMGAMAFATAGCAGTMGREGPKIDATPTAPANESLDAGPLLGARTATGAKIWVRIDPARIDAEQPTMLRLELVGAPEGSARSFDAEASVEGDGTAVFRLEGLKPDHHHRYRITRADGEAVTLAEGSFATAPARMTRARIAFGAGAQADAATEATFRAIEREQPDALVLMVDSPSAASTSLAAQRAHYRTLSRSRAFSELVAEIPLYAVKCRAESARLGADEGLAEKSNSRRAFSEYHPNPSFGDGVDGIHAYFALGSAEVFLLDGTTLAPVGSPRDETAFFSKAGEAQWIWLEESLARSASAVKVIVLGSAWNGSAETRSVLRRLAATVARARADGVVLVSTDGARSRVVRHATAAVAGYDLVEFVAGPMHGAAASDAVEVAPGVLFDRCAPQAFLILDIEEARADGPALRAVFVDAQGSVIHTHEVGLPSLAPAR